MGMRDMIVQDTIEHFVSIGEFKPSDTDIRLVSNDVGDGFVEANMMTIGQLDRISQDRTVKSVRTGLRKHGRY